MTGLTPNQVRSQLRNVEIGVNAPAAPAAPPPIFQTLPEFKPEPTQDQGFEPRPFALQVPLPPNRATSATDSGATVDISLCRDNGDGTFTPVTGHFINGRLDSVS